MKYRKLLDELSRPQLHPGGNGAGNGYMPHTRHAIQHSIPGLDIQYTAPNCYRVQVAGDVYDLERARIEVRPGGRRRNMIRWLIGYVQGILTVFLLGFVEEFDAVTVGLHAWLDYFIRRTGVTFVHEWFRLLDFGLKRASR